VATATLPGDELARLREALLATAAAPELAPVMERLLLTGFAVPDPADYRPLAAMAVAATPPFEEL
jgi:hypothetical protein